MTTYAELAETAAQILAPAFPDADEVTFSALVDDVLQELAQRFQEIESR